MEIDINNIPGGEPDEASGDEGEGLPNGKGKVAYETYAKTVSAEKRAKAELKKAQEQLAARQRDDEAKKEEELRKRGEFEALAKQQSDQIKALNERLQAKNKEDLDRRKAAAILNGLGGNVDRKYFGLLDIDSVLVHPDTGEIDELSVNKAVDSFKKEYPEVIRTSGGPRVPAAAPNGNAPKDTITYKEYLDLPVKEQKVWAAKQMRNPGTIRD